jgi:hypothetical protein
MTRIQRQGQRRAGRALVRARRLAFGGFGILLAACEPDRPVPDPQSKCRVVGDNDFIRNAIRVDHYKPNDCPLLIIREDYREGGFGKSYEANEIAPIASVNEGTLILTWIENQHGQRKEEVETVMRRWSYDAEVVRAYISGFFNRASVPLCNLCRFHDVAFHWLVARDNEVAEARVEMPYYDSYIADIGGPNWCPRPEYQCPNFPGAFVLKATVTNAFNGPYLYEWFRDGESMGPPSTDNYIIDYGQVEGTHQTYQVAVIDTLRARVMSEQLRVWIPYSEQSGCDPTAIQCPE